MCNQNELAFQHTGPGSRRGPAHEVRTGFQDPDAIVCRDAADWRFRLLTRNLRQFKKRLETQHPTGHFPTTRKWSRTRSL